MYNSIFGKRFLKWVCSPKTFQVKMQVKIGEKYTFLELNTVAHTRREATIKAKKDLLDVIEIVIIGSKSLGKCKRIDEF